jgi:hypothetical protein
MIIRKTPEVTLFALSQRKRERERERRSSTNAVTMMIKGKSVERVMRAIGEQPAI